MSSCHSVVNFFPVQVWLCRILAYSVTSYTKTETVLPGLKAKLIKGYTGRRNMARGIQVQWAAKGRADPIMDGTLNKLTWWPYLLWEPLLFLSTRCTCKQPHTSRHVLRLPLAKVTHAAQAAHERKRLQPLRRSVHQAPPLLLLQLLLLQQLMQPLQLHRQLLLLLHLLLPICLLLLLLLLLPLPLPPHCPVTQRCCRARCAGAHHWGGCVGGGAARGGGGGDRGQVQPRVLAAKYAICCGGGGAWRRGALAHTWPLLPPSLLQLLPLPLLLLLWLLLWRSHVQEG